MAKRRKVSNLLALAVLSYLTQQPMHPYQLGRTLRDHGDQRSIKFNHGSLYMVVQQLAKAGLIVAQETTRAEQRPERTVYALTDAGRAELRDWLRELVEVPQHEYPQFVGALSLIAALPPGEVVERLGRRLGRLAAQRVQVRGLIDRTLAQGVHPAVLVEEDYRLALLDAESVFVERFIEQITHPETGWGRPWGPVPRRARHHQGKGAVMTHIRTALVIGGGIAGPVAAMALRQAGIQATAYEAHPRGAEGIGVFLTLASNGIDALRTIDADKPALAAGFPTPGITLRSTTGKSLGTARTGLPLANGTTSHTLKRADLYKAIHDEATSRGVVVEHGKRLLRVEQTDTGVRALFADGSDATGEVLIGADGIHSVVRRCIDPHTPAPTYVGLVNLGGYARGVPVDAEPGSYTMIFGKRAFFGYVLTPGGEVWWFANLPRVDEPARGEVEAITAEQWQHELAELYAEDAGPAVRLVQASDPADIMRASPTHSLVHLPVWHAGRMIVIGDAAHAPTPSSGQGASLAIEDAVVLAKCLRDLPYEQALRAYERLRRARVERIAKVAARVNSSKAAGPVARVVRDALLPAIMRMTANSKQVTEQYRYHIDWDTPTSPVTA